MDEHNRNSGCINAEENKMNRKELLQALEEHDRWLDSGGKRGKKAEFNDVDFRGLNIRWQGLDSIDFKRANLNKANLKYMHAGACDFRGADFREANLTGANIHYCDLRGAKFDIGILVCESLEGTKWLSTDIPWYLQHPDYAEWADTIEILDG